jgi:Arc/MetJ family transcription regulator
MKRRTNIELEMDYVEEIMRRYRLRTKTDAVDLALRYLAGLPMTKAEALAMQGAYPDFEVPPDEPPVATI